MADRERSYLLVPAGGAGEGIGHLVRCVALSRQLGSRVSFLLTHVDHAARQFLRNTLSRRHGAHPELLARAPPGKQWDLVVVDARRIGARELDELSRHGLVACIDEGGEAREFAPFLVDTMPGPPHRSPANLSGPSLLLLPRRRRMAPPQAFRRILLSLGGEDREGLGQKLARAMIAGGLCGPDQLTVVQGPLGGRREWPAGVAVADGGRGISRLLGRHDLLITHFGITAFEALATGIPVILFNPTPYHESLGKSAGLPMIGVGTPNMRALRSMMSSPSRLHSHVERFHQALQGDRRGGLVGALRLLTRTGSASCPVCGRRGNPVIARFSDRTYRRCTRCGTIGLESFSGRRARYDSAYFSSEYRAQYGRTYLEDFEAIRYASRPRAAIVRRLLGAGRTGVVLDVGCAYGPFLAAAAEAGLAGYGLDISPGAATYVRKKLRIPAIRADFETVTRSRLPKGISAVTLWYVIEHFPRTADILATASSLLTSGGVLAFSTPNGRGVSARKDLVAFLRNSPGDHFTVLSPRGLARILAEHGLDLRRVRITGHHPERFPGVLGSWARRSGAGARIMGAISVLLRLGDTFEAYAVKRPPARQPKGLR